jgi:hypothetical protein
MTNWINRNKNLIIRLAFLVPIILVSIISISHVISWYNLANPISWAIYLSIAIEIAAMSSIAAASVKVKGFSVWLVFIMVTLIQFIGNIYFCYAEINTESSGFKNWVELTAPLFEMMGSDLKDVLAQKRLLALLEGGLLPLISLTCLHFFIQYEDTKIEIKEASEDPIEEKTLAPESIDIKEELELITLEEKLEDSIVEVEKITEDSLEEKESQVIEEQAIEEKKNTTETKNKLEEAVRKDASLNNVENVVVTANKSTISSKMKRIHKK